MPCATPSSPRIRRRCSASTPKTARLSIVNADAPHAAPFELRGRGEIAKHLINRRRDMPPRYTTQDMAADYATVLDQELGLSHLMGQGIRLGAGARNEWDVRLNVEVPTDLRVQMGAGESDLVLDSLTLRGSICRWVLARARWT